MFFDYQISKLTEKFYEAYPQESFPELMVKNRRAYTCLLIDLHKDYYICIPFRSDIRHNTAFKFKNSKRSKNHRSGLDYTKIVIIKNPDYNWNR